MEEVCETIKRLKNNREAEDEKRERHYY